MCGRRDPISKFDEAATTIKCHAAWPLDGIFGADAAIKGTGSANQEPHDGKHIAIWILELLKLQGSSGRRLYRLDGTDELCSRPLQSDQSSLEVVDMKV